MITILNVPTEREFSQRKLETYAKYCQVLQWGRSHPVEFTERFMGISLLDIQKYAIAGAWNAEFIAWLESRNAGKTTQAAIYTMNRTLLIPFHNTYFLGNTGAQAKEVFLKIEKIAKREIESFTGSTEVFFNELRQLGATGDGFVRDPSSFHTEAFNGSAINTLNSDVVNIKGKRASLVVFDEAGWFGSELFVQAEQFTNQDENFKLGGNINLALEPKNFPRQLLYSSSASDEESGFYKKVRSFTRQMLMGNTSYFVCNFNADVVRTATFNGDPYPPLLSQVKIDKAMQDDYDKAMRELYNHFSAGVHEGQIATARDLMQCTITKPPLLGNPDGVRRFILAWDSARLNDNSVILVAELINDEKIGWRMELANIYSLVDVATKGKTPLRLPEQVERFKDILLAYNGNDFGKLDYENIEVVLMDAGAGGQIIGGASDYLLANWERDGVVHRGMIDPLHKANETARNAYPDAIRNVQLVDPKGNRNDLFKAIEDLLKLDGVIKLPAIYDGKDYLNMFTDDGLEEVRYPLNTEEQIGLMQVELLRKELTTMCKYTNGDSVTYNFPPEYRGVMHDDRVYAFGLLCWYLARLRRKQIIQAPVKREPPVRKTCVSALPV